MSTTTPKLSLPRAESADYFNLSNYDALIDAIDTNAVGQVEKGKASGIPTLDVNALIPLSQIPATLTGKDADTVDGKHATDLVQFVNGAVPIGTPINLTNVLNIFSNRLKGFGTNNNSLMIAANGGTVSIRPVSDSSTTGEMIISSTGATLGGNTVWTSGNQGPTSGMNADLLDGQHGSYYATATHNHDGVYVKTAGDIMTGSLRSTTANPLISKLSTYKSAVFTHLSANQLALQFSTTADQEDWNTASQFIFDANGNLTVPAQITAASGSISGTLAAVSFTEGGTTLSSKYALSSRKMTAGSGLTGGGDLTADRTLSVSFAGTGSATTVSRSDHTHTLSAVTDIAVTTPATNDLLIYSATTGKWANSTLSNAGIAPLSHVGSGGNAHAVVTTSVNGFMAATDKTKLDGIENNANNYTHPSGDGYSHVPATGTTNNTKVLKAGSTANSATWGQVLFSEVGSKPTTLSGYGITDATPSSHIGTGGSAHAQVTQSTDGFMSAADKQKLDSIAPNSAPQNTFTYITVGTSNIIASTTGDTLTFAAGSNITLTPDTTNKKVTIGVTSPNGFASVVAGGTTLSASSPTSSLTLANGTGISITGSGTTATVAVVMDDTLHGSRSGGSLHSAVTTSTNGFMIAADKAKLDTFVVTSPASNQLLKYNGTSWVNTTLAATDIPSLDWTKIASGKPTTLSGYGITDAINSSNAATTATANKLLYLDANAKLPANITGNADGNAATATKLATTRSIGHSGDVTGSATFDGSADVTIAMTLANSGVTAGTYKSVTVDAKGRVTGGSNPTTLSGYGITDAVASSTIVTTATANKVLQLDANSKLPASITGNADGNAATASKWATARTISLAGDASGSVSLDGSANVTLTLTNNYKSLASLTDTTITSVGTGHFLRYNGTSWVNTLLVAGDIPSLDWSKITTGKPTTLSGYGITDAINTSSAVTSAAANKLLYLDASGNLPASVTGNAATATKLQTGRTITLTGDATASATTFDGSANISIATTLANSGVAAGTYRSVTVNAKGLVTGGTNPTTISGYGITDAYTKSEINTVRNETLDNFVYSGMNVTASTTTNLAINVATGTVYVGGVRYTPAAVTGMVLTASTTQYIYVDSTGAIKNSTTAPSGDYADLATVVVPASGLIASSSVTDTRDIIANTRGKMSYDVYNDSGTYAFYIGSRGAGNGLQIKNTGNSNAFVVTDGDTSKDMLLVDGSGNVKLENGADFYVYSDAGTTQKFFVDGATGNTTITGTLGVTGTITGTLSGNASTASKWATARTITLAGDVSGSVSIDGSANVTLTVTDTYKSLASLTDTTITTAASGQFLRYNGTAWVNTALVAADIPSLDWTKITTGKPTTVSGYGITDAVTTARTVSTSTGLTGGGALSANLTLSFDTTWGDARYATKTGATFTGNITAPVIISNVAAGTAPLTVTSTTVVANLNADMVDGYHMNQDVRTTASPTFAALTTTGAIVSGTSVTITPAGTATSTTNYASDAFQLQTSTWNGTAAVTNTRKITVDTANTLQFTNTSGTNIASIDNSGNISGNTLKSTVATGTAPLTVSSTTLVTNLNADLLDGQSGSYYTNQNAFSNVLVGSSTIAADSATDTLTIAANLPITVTADTTNDKVTIDINNATASADGAMAAADKSKLDGIDAGANKTPAGAIMQFGGSAAPSGWLLCQGQAVSRTTYSALYTAIGTTYGAGDGSTTFNVPNIQGRVPVGYNSADANFNALGKTGGEATHTLSTNEMPAHSHNVKFGGNFMSMSGGSTGYYNLTGWTTGGGAAQVVEDPAGGGAAHNNLQPYITLNYIIKY